MRNVLQPTLIYAAAIIDAKACIGSYLGANGYRVELIVTSKHRAVCDRLRDVFGVGNIRRRGAISWEWKVYQRDAVDVLEQSLPHMIAQRNDAYAILDFHEQFETQKPKGRKKNDRTPRTI